MQILQWFEDLSTGLKDLHTKRIAHMDLSPEVKDLSLFLYMSDYPVYVFPCLTNDDFDSLNLLFAFWNLILAEHLDR